MFLYEHILIAHALIHIKTPGGNGNRLTSSSIFLKLMHNNLRRNFTKRYVIILHIKPLNRLSIFHFIGKRKVMITRIIFGVLVVLKCVAFGFIDVVVPIHVSRNIC